jgi:drug/metabolite transporter (DMT)-like permease
MWLIYAILAAALWGLNYALAERILSNISVTTLLAIEMFIGAIIFFIASLFLNIRDDISTIISHPKMMLFVIVEIVVVLSANALIAYSIQAKNATFAGMIELMYPLFTILFAWLIFNDNQISMKLLLGGGLILAGVSMLQS